MYPVCVSAPRALASETDLRAYTVRVSNEINGLAPATVYDTGFAWQLADSIGTCHSPVVFWDVVCTMHARGVRVLERAQNEQDNVLATAMYKQSAALFACIASSVLPMWPPSARVLVTVRAPGASPVTGIPPWLSSESWDALARVA